MSDYPDNPLVVVGLACNFPGSADSPAAFWSLLEGAIDATGEIPEERWDRGRYYSPEPAVGKMYAERGGFIDDVCGFDAEFFGISESEARGMDPQHRILLETTWKALENSGIAPSSLSGTKTGVFFGPAQNEFLGRNFRHAGFGGVNGLFCMAAGRVAHFLNLSGPTFALDTACSSSLVALHVACQSLLAGECETAIVAASQAIVNPIQHLLLSELNVLSPDGRCKTFSEDADGFARAEGCGALIVMRLDQARRRRLTPRAIVRGTAINHDGHTPALIAPSPDAQREVLVQALARGGMRPEEVTFVETHGTGTAVGDPKEVDGILRAFGAERTGRVTLGAVKTNLGHLEQAAGMAALVKTVLSLERGEIPPNRQVGSLNPALDLANAPARVPTQRVPWQRNDRGALVAGVSGFGFSGTNAHVLLEEFRAEQEAPAGPARDAHLLCLSAKTATALRRQAADLDEFLRCSPSTGLAEAAYTLAVGRSAFDHRLAVVAADVEQARRALRAAAAERSAPGLTVGKAGRARRVVFLYSGQGAQSPGMGKHLYDTEPVFREALDTCDRMLRGGLDRGLLEVMFDGGEDIHATRYAQPCLFAFEYAMTTLLASWGIVPDAVVGHSVGEYAAACAAGVLSLPDALWLINERSKHMSQVPSTGAMASFAASVDDLTEMLAVHSDTVAVAAVNGRRSTVLSGDAADLAEIVAAAAERGFRATPLKVSHAFHSPLMDGILDAFEHKARRVGYSPPSIPLVSNLTGTFAGETTVSGRYFRDHIREPVLFAPGIEKLAAAGYDLFVEIGPHPVLGQVAAQSAPEARFVTLQQREVDPGAMLLAGTGELFAAGVTPDWAGFHAGRERRCVELPTMPFEHKRFWVTDTGPLWREDRDTEALRPLARVRSVAAPDPDQFATEVSFEEHPYLTDHRVAGMAIFPGAGYIEMIVEALACEYPDERFEVRGLTFERAAVLPEDGRRHFSIRLDAEADGGHRVEIYGREDGAREEWVRHASAVAVPATATPRVDADGWAGRFTVAVPVAEHYAALAEDGLHYGPLFRGVHKLWQSTEAPDEALAEVRLPGGNDAADYAVHPALLDACFHAIGVAQRGAGAPGGTFLPAGVDRLTLGIDPRGAARAAGQTPVTQVRCRVRVARTHSPDVLMTEVEIVAASGVVLVLEGLRLQRTEGAALRRLVDNDIAEAFVVPGWEHAGAVAELGDAVRGQHWLVLGGDDALTDAATAALAAAGATASVLTSGPTDRPGAEAVSVSSVDSLADGMRAAAGRGGHLDGVLCLWPVGPWAGEDPQDAESTLRAVEFACGGAMRTVQALADCAWSPAPRLVLATRGAHRVLDADFGSPARAAVWGLGRVAAVEHPEFACALVDLDPLVGDPERAATDLVRHLGASGDGSEWQIALRDGDHYVFRLDAFAAPADLLAAPASESFALVTHQPGLLDELALDPVARRVPGEGEIEVAVEVASINFRDVMNAMGVYPGGPEPLGHECAGRVSAVGPGVRDLAVGDQVVASLTGAFGAYAIGDAAAAVRRPAGLAPAQAATVPVAFLTVEYAFAHLAALRPGERVLIHAAAGGVGLAAVQYARFVGAEVFATAGSPRKRELLRGLGVRHVFDSRSLDFEHEVLAATDGAGVDVVLNSLAEEFVTATLRTVRPGGRFVEIGKVTVLEPDQVPEGIRYFHFDLKQVPGELWREMLGAVLGRLADGAFHSLPVQVFDARQSVRAFRHMASGRHIGKLALRFGARSADRLALTEPGTYLVTGGLGGLGLRMAETLLAAGASTVVLTGRREPTPEIADRLRALDPDGTRVVLVRGDIARDADAEALFARLRTEFAPLRGILHLAGVIEDAILTRQTDESLRRVLEPKVRGALHLHRLSAGLPLEFFVLFSSMTSVLGTAGQANYAAGNAYLDALANYRQSIGLPGLSINWGAFSEVGMAAREADKLIAPMRARGMDAITPEEGEQALIALLDSHAAQVAVIPASWPKYVRTAPPALRRTLSRLDRSGGAVEAEAAARAGADLSSAEAVHDLVAGEIRGLLYLDADYPIEDDEALEELGLDSLRAVELRNSLGRKLGSVLSATLLFDYPTLGALTAHLAHDLLGLGVDSDEPAAPQAPAAAPEDPVAALDIDDVISNILRQIESLPETAQGALIGRLLED